MMKFLYKSNFDFPFYWITGAVIFFITALSLIPTTKAAVTPNVRKKQITTRMVKFFLIIKSKFN